MRFSFNTLVRTNETSICILSTGDSTHRRFICSVGNNDNGFAVTLENLSDAVVKDSGEGRQSVAKNVLEDARSGPGFLGNKSCG
jgi:hypothetical protein